MATELFTTPAGERVTILTGSEAVEHVLRVARECAARGGVVAAETVAILLEEINHEHVAVQVGEEKREQ